MKFTQYAKHLSYTVIEYELSVRRSMNIEIFTCTVVGTRRGPGN